MSIDSQYLRISIIFLQLMFIKETALQVLWYKETYIIQPLLLHPLCLQFVSL